MSAISEYYEESVYAGDDVESAPENFMDFLPSFPEEMMVGSLAHNSNGVVLRFSPEGFVLSASEVPTPIRPLWN